MYIQKKGLYWRLKKEGIFMKTLQTFIDFLCGEFDNIGQYNRELVNHQRIHPLARHVNTIMNERIVNLPMYYEGYFILEESYYTIDDKTNAQPHIFEFHLNDANNVVLTSYDIPQEYTKDTFKADNPNVKLDYQQLQISTKFNAI